MKILSLSVDEVRQQAGDYTYALIYEISRVLFGKTSEIDPIHWDEVIDARFFDAQGEIHLFDDGDGPRAYEISDSPDDNSAVVRYQLNNGAKFQETGNTLSVKEYLDFDEDGQAIVCCRRLEGIGREE